MALDAPFFFPELKPKLKPVVPAAGHFSLIGIQAVLRNLSVPAVALQLCLQFSSKLFTAGRVCFSTYYSQGFAVVSGSALYFE